jgi:hypothetical protein
MIQVCSHTHTRQSLLFTSPLTGFGVQIGINLVPDAVPCDLVQWVGVCYEGDGVIMSGTNVAAKSRPTSLADSLVYLHSKHAKFGGWWLTILNSSCIR